MVVEGHQVEAQAPHARFPDFCLREHCVSDIARIHLGQDADVAKARRVARVLAGVCGLDNRGQIRFATAVSEITRNAFQYGGGGIATFRFQPHGMSTRLAVRVVDQGPGIRNLRDILRGRYESPAGAGMGISGARELVHAFDIQTGGDGTRVDLAINVDGKDIATLAQEAAARLADIPRDNPDNELVEQNRALRDAMAHQQFLAREIHHRTKNNLSVIQSLASLQARLSDDPAVSRAMLVFAGRIQAIAQVHVNFYQSEQATTVDARKHVTDIVKRAMDSHSGRLAVVIDAESCPVDIDTATEIGLALNEILSNAARHAYDGRTVVVVHLSLALVDGRMVITVADDGPGIVDAAASLAASRTLGWRIVQSSAAKLGADLLVDGSAGLKVTMSFEPKLVEAAV